MFHKIVKFINKFHITRYRKVSYVLLEKLYSIVILIFNDFLQIFSLLLSNPHLGIKKKYLTQRVSCSFLVYVGYIPVS